MTNGGTVSPIQRVNKGSSATDQAIEAAAQAEAAASDRKADKLLALALEKWRPGKTETGSPMAVPLDGTPSAIVVGDRMGDIFKDELANLAYENLGEVPAGSTLSGVARDSCCLVPR